MRCQTLRCNRPAVFSLVWDDMGHPEPLCSTCADHYAARPHVMARASIEPLPPLKSMRSS
jgi:hypothetical protein